MTCAVSADRPHDWADVICAIWKGQREADRQGINEPRCEILTPDPEWYDRHVKYAGPMNRRHRKPIGILVVGFAEKE